MPHVDTDRCRLFYAGKKGPEGGPVLVLVHGAGGSHLHWPAKLRRLDGATVYALDLPGHGRSDGDGRERIEDYGADVVGFLDAIDVDAAVVVGHSMGGAVAQQLALSEGERVSALVLVGTGARLRVAPAILEGIEEDFDAAVELITGYAWSEGTDARLIDIGRKDLLSTDPQVVLSDFTACDRFDVMERLGQIECPTLVIGGTADRLTPLKYGRYLSEEIPDARLVAVPGAGHMVMLERPEAVVSAISGFVKGSR